MFRLRYGLVITSLLGFAACVSPAGPDTATVYYVLDAPLCSSIIPVEFRIDQVLVATDTFRVNLSPNHTMSQAFVVPVGSHTLGALMISNSFAWPDTVVQVSAGAVVHDTLPMYCS